MNISVLQNMNQEYQDELWIQAMTLSELGEATARWIEGKVSYHPCYRTDIDHETNRLSEQLTFLNRNGLVTTFSQPAEPLDDDGFSQRACVDGYATEEVARRIGALGLYTELLVLIYPPGVEDGIKYQSPSMNFDHLLGVVAPGGTKSLNVSTKNVQHSQLTL